MARDHHSKTLRKYQGAIFQQEDLTQDLKNLEYLWQRRREDPGTFLSRTRTFAEKLLRLVCAAHNLEVNTSKNQLPTLHNYAIALEQADKGGRMPSYDLYLATHVNLLRASGNQAVHHSGELPDLEQLDKVMDALDLLLGWAQRHSCLKTAPQPALERWSAMTHLATFALGGLTVGALALLWSLYQSAAPLPLPLAPTAEVTLTEAHEPPAQATEDRPGEDTAQPQAPAGEASSGASLGEVALGEVDLRVLAQQEAPPSPKPAAQGAHTVLHIPKGRFWRGSTREPDTQPVERVTLDEYWLDQTEVTVDAYRACVQRRKCTAPAQGPEFTWNQPGLGQHPVNGVSWDQAKAYCRWKGGRLPTEAQWEKAARGDDAEQLDYPWGSSRPTCQYANMKDARGEGCGAPTGGPRTKPVGLMSMGISRTGALDMAGNLWEWTEDVYFKGAYSQSGTRNPWWGKKLRGEQVRVYRGGSFGRQGAELTVWHREGLKQSTQNSGIGFRCAYEKPPAGALVQRQDK